VEAEPVVVGCVLGFAGSGDARKVWIKLQERSGRVDDGSVGSSGDLVLVLQHGDYSAKCVRLPSNGHDKETQKSQRLCALVGTEKLLPQPTQPCISRTNAH
jgi:hypothetical protein